MLVLTRKRDESIKIGSNIVIRVMKTSHGSVKIGIDAPQDVRVIRGELATVELPEAAELYSHVEFDGSEEALMEVELVQS